MSCDTLTITAGEDVSVLVQLQNGTGLSYTGALNGNVTACLVDKRTASTINGNVVAQSDTGNANWAAGILEVTFSDLDTMTFETGVYYMQVNVVENGGDIRKVLIRREFTVRSAA